MCCVKGKELDDDRVSDCLGGMKLECQVQDAMFVAYRDDA